MRIRWRLTWFGIGFTALVLVGFILLISVLVIGSASQDQEDLLASVADEAAGGLGEIDVAVVQVSIPPVLPDATTSDQTFITVYDTGGLVMYATGLVDGEPLELPTSVVQETLETGGASTSFLGVATEVRPWQSRDGGAGVVAASQSERVVATQLVGLRWFMVVFGIIALIAAAIGAWFMAGRAIRPLKLLADTTDSIGSTGDLSRRLPQVSQNDEVGALTESFNSMLEGLEQSRRDRDLTIDAQKRFVADASHELRSPLTSIRANAGFLVERQDASEMDRLDATRDIAHEADRMSGLIDDLLLLARSDVRTDATDGFVSVDLTTIARSVERRARHLGVSVEVNAAEGAVVSGLGDELAELIWILVDNADRHGGANAIVTIDQTDEHVTIVVDDDGDGLPDEDLERVFDRFHRSDPARSGPGYGLGLAIARSIVERHGGSIDASNGPDGGAVFSVRLPSVG